MRVVCVVYDRMVCPKQIAMSPYVMEYEGGCVE